MNNKNKPTYTQKIGSVNACETMALFDKDNNIIGRCFDTPNAFAYACVLSDKVIKGKAYYKYFGDDEATIRERNSEDNKERMRMFNLMSQEEKDKMEKYITFS